MQCGVLVAFDFQVHAALHQQIPVPGRSHLITDNEPFGRQINAQRQAVELIDQCPQRPFATLAKPPTAHLVAEQTQAFVR